MVTSAQALKKYGAPEKELHMTLWEVPAHLQVPPIPNKIYCNKDLVKPLLGAICELHATGHIKELKTYDGCFNIRNQRGSVSKLSLHSWGLAIDVNQATNALGAKPTLSAGFVKCFTNNGFTWGGNFKRLDGMHFELSNI
jgi:hypothetical protein